MRTVLALVLCLAALVPVARAQRAYIDHHTYPVDFSTLTPGDAVVGHEGVVWRHDGTGWYWDSPSQLLPPAPTEMTNKCPGLDPYTATDEEVTRCLTIPPPTNPWTGKPFSYEVGTIYQNGYSHRAVVLSITPDIGSPRHVVTIRILRGGGAHDVDTLRAFYADRGLWFPLRPGARP